VIAHLIHHYYSQSGDLFDATRRTVAELRGAYAIGVVALASPDLICCARMGCPLLIGRGEGENYFASDVSAILSQTRRVVYLDEGDVAAVSRAGIHIVDRDGQTVERPERISAVAADAIELGPYDHYMQKEIHEQPRAAADTLEGVIDAGIKSELFGAEAAAMFDQKIGRAHV
jgi:glucosamine--fructose-6-phosphate aminotransferase (isomerizing)